MDEWTTKLELDEILYTITVNRIYCTSIDEFYFEVKIKIINEVFYTSEFKLYSKNEVENWIRQTLNCAGREFDWVAST